METTEVPDRATRFDPPDVRRRKHESRSKARDSRFDRERALRERGRLSSDFVLLLSLPMGALLAYRGYRKSQSRASADAPPSET